MSQTVEKYLISHRGRILKNVLDPHPNADNFPNLTSFSEREFMFTFALSSPVCMFVTFVHPTQAIEIFGNVYLLRQLVRWPSVDIQ